MAIVNLLTEKMIPQVLFLISSRFGHSEKIAHVLADHLQKQRPEIEVTYSSLEKDTTMIDLKNYDLVVFVASIRYGHFHRKLKEFVVKNQAALKNRLSALCVVNLVARDPEKRTPESNSYTRRFLRTSPWQPDLCAVFAGNLHYARYRFWDKYLIGLIMKLTGGPTDLNTHIEHTDWAQVKDFADKLLLSLRE